MRRWLSVLVPVVLLALVGGALWWRTAPPERAQVVDPAASATYGDFTIDTVEGPLALSSLRGKAVVVYFGYLSCPDICPTTMATMGAAFDQLSPEQRARATVLMVSVDPERDRPDGIAGYVTYFGEGFLGGTADKATIDAAAADWGVVYRKVGGEGSSMAYMVDHSTQSFLVAPSGEMVGVMAHGTPPDAVAARLRTLLEAP